MMHNTTFVDGNKNASTEKPFKKIWSIHRLHQGDCTLLLQELSWPKGLMEAPRQHEDVAHTGNNKMLQQYSVHYYVAAGPLHSIEPAKRPLISLPLNFLQNSLFHKSVKKQYNKSLVIHSRIELGAIVTLVTAPTSQITWMINITLTLQRIIARD